MSRLELYGRPLVLFDAASKEHRQFFNNFLATGSWGSCPYRFAVADDHGHLIGHIQAELLKYYMGREFKGVAKEPQVKVRQKRKKTVDN
jgi:hypothetical protein